VNTISFEIAEDCELLKQIKPELLIIINAGHEICKISPTKQHESIETIDEIAETLKKIEADIEEMI
jgi:hypothetical protein